MAKAKRDHNAALAGVANADTSEAGTPQRKLRSGKNPKLA